jgi:hypothetical protein
MEDFSDCTCPPHHNEVGLNKYLDEEKIPVTCCIRTGASIQVNSGFGKEPRFVIFKSFAMNGKRSVSPEWISLLRKRRSVWQRRYKPQGLREMANFSKRETPH